MSLVTGVCIFFLGLLQGFLNTIAGGGTFIVLPVLTFLGLGIDVANGTNRIAIVMQSAAGALGFQKQKMSFMNVALPLALVMSVGALVGARVVVDLDKDTLNLVIAAIITVMAILLLVRPGMWEAKSSRAWPKWASWLLFFAIGVYAGFIQAGVGFFMSWALVAAMGVDLVRGNAIKTVVVGFSNVASLLLFYYNGLIDIRIGLVLGIGSVFGAWLGAKFSVLKGNDWVRRILAVVIILSAVKMVHGVLF